MQQMINKCCVLLGKKFGSFDRGLRSFVLLHILSFRRLRILRKNPKRAIKPDTLYEVSKTAIHYIWKKGGKGEGWRRVSVGKVGFSFSKTAKNESDKEKKKTKANLKYLFEVFPEPLKWWVKNTVGHCNKKSKKTRLQPRIKILGLYHSDAQHTD